MGTIKQAPPQATLNQDHLEELHHRGLREDLLITRKEVRKSYFKEEKEKFHINRVVGVSRREWNKSLKEPKKNLRRENLLFGNSIELMFF